MSSNVGGTFFDDVYTNDDPSLHKAILAFTHKNFGTVFTDDKNGFYIKAKDGTVRNYALDINFYDKDHSAPSLTWNDGTKNTVEYSNTDKTGCGSSNFASVVQKSNDDLVATGKTSYGDIVYELKNKDDLLLKDIYDNSYNPAAYGDKNTKISYEAFIKAHPLFFWYDGMGRLIKFQNATFMPQAECGKPVIYLYPEKEMDVSVKVSPRGGMSVSMPPHHDGWKVRATEESVITEKSTGNSYPYLFWEGSGAIYETPKKGFVVEKGKVHNFLLEKLHALGLNEKETGDFLEFWEPKMKSSPYYFVTFLGNKQMNDIAPLAIDPKPETVIRVLMDFMPLQEKIEVEEYEIHTPQRKGFTVVEWGGVLR